MASTISGGERFASSSRWPDRTQGRSILSLMSATRAETVERSPFGTCNPREESQKMRFSKPGCIFNPCADSTPNACEWGRVRSLSETRSLGKLQKASEARPTASIACTGQNSILAHAAAGLPASQRLRGPRLKAVDAHPGTVATTTWSGPSQVSTSLNPCIDGRLLNDLHPVLVGLLLDPSPSGGKLAVIGEQRLNASTRMQGARGRRRAAALQRGDLPGISPARTLYRDEAAHVFDAYPPSRT